MKVVTVRSYPSSWIKYRRLCLLLIASTFVWMLLSKERTTRLVHAIGRLGGVNISTSTENDNRTFFLLETSGSAVLNARQACSAESTARQHPDNTVNFLMTGRPNTNSTYISALRTFPNVRIEHVNLEDVFKNTSFASWYRSPERLKSPYAVSHLSDAMRTALLWRHGGFYLDTDVVVIRSLLKLRNAIGLQSEFYANSAVMTFDQGHPILQSVMRQSVEHYDPKNWHAFGPAKFTTFLNETCPQGLSGNVTVSCGPDLIVLPTTAFHPIHYTQWRSMLGPSKTAELLSKTKDSYVLHFWGRMSGKTVVDLGRGSLYDVAAKRYCPVVYRIAQRAGKF